MNARSLAVAAATALTVLSTSISSAEAGPPGKWTQVTPAGSDIGNTMRVGLARTPDGVLHVGWARVGATTEQVAHSAISADAKSVSGPDAIFTNTEGGVNTSVALVRDPAGGLRAFFGATNQFDGSLGTATSADGVAWSGAATASFGGSAGKPVYAAGGIGAGVGLDGTWYSIWGDSAPGGGGLHVGLDPAAPDQDLPGGLTSDPGIGVDAVGGQVVAAWNQVGTHGVTVMPVGGAATTIPNSVGQVQNRAAITGRNGKPGVFVAYTRGSNPFLAKPSIYRVDTGARTLLSKQDGEDIAIAAGPAGRLWVLWKDGTEIHATRSNGAATRWGRIVSVKAPKGAELGLRPRGRGEQRRAGRARAGRARLGDRELAPAPAAGADAQGRQGQAGQDGAVGDRRRRAGGRGDGEGQGRRLEDHLEDGQGRVLAGEGQAPRQRREEGLHERRPERQEEVVDKSGYCR